MASTHVPEVEGPARADSTSSWLPFVIAGAASVLAGGFLAAAGGEAPSRHLSWACAYLVLVCGSAQIFLGGGRVLVATRLPAPKVVAWQLGTFNLGNAGVLAGTLLATPVLLYVGSALLVTALVLFAWDTRGAAQPGIRLVIYRLGVIALAVSVPIGAILGS